ncbi:MAG: carboxypeptidase regulatory-like domain-containing protein, partial [Planctomycetales bacterium]|nr:carboxypeptidase regulatory-like domain-containing protein [Planctomycetales bacterium]
MSQGSCFQSVMSPCLPGVVAVALVVLAGCGKSGPELAEVAGKVALDGKPVAGAKVVFQPQDGGSTSSAITNDDGYYELYFGVNQPGAMPGKHRVSITTGRPSSSEEFAQGITYPERVPPKYNDE